MKKIYICLLALLVFLLIGTASYGGEMYSSFVKHSEGMFWSVVIFLLGILFFASGFIALSRKRMIENMPTSKIRSIAMGLVEIFGGVVPVKGKLLKSPLSGKSCVYYEYKVQEYVKSGKSSRWVTFKADEESRHFYLKDNTGQVLVDPTDANVDVSKNFEVESGMGRDPPEHVKKFLRENRIDFEGILGINRKMRFLEYVIVPGQRLYILGTAGDNPFLKEATAKHGVEDIMIQKGRGEKIYYISDKEERMVVKKFKRDIWIGILLGSLFIIVSFTAFLGLLGFL